jgi:hypothetical protein
VVASVDAGRYVERSTRAVGDYVDEWLEVVWSPAALDTTLMHRPRLRCSAGRSPRVSATGPMKFMARVPWWPSALSHRSA